MNKKQFKLSKKEVMQLAWLFVRNEAVSISEALKKAWLNIKCQAALHLNNVVEFTFRKVDGTLRKAHGTLKLEGEYGEGSRRKNDLVQVYYDTDKQAFRSFRKFNLIAL